MAGVVRVVSDERPEIIREFCVLGTWRERLRGLLGAKRDAPQVLLTRCRSIHTWGMRHPIDVAFVGELGEVLSVQRGLPPRHRARCPEAACTLERLTCEKEWVEEGEHLWVRSFTADGVGA